MHGFRRQARRAGARLEREARPVADLGDRVAESGFAGSKRFNGLRLHRRSDKRLAGWRFCPVDCHKAACRSTSEGAKYDTYRAPD